MEEKYMHEIMGKEVFRFGLGQAQNRLISNELNHNKLSFKECVN